MAFIREIPLEEATGLVGKVLDAVGAEPDETFMNLDEELRRTLAVGRPFGGAS